MEKYHLLILTAQDILLGVNPRHLLCHLAQHSLKVFRQFCNWVVAGNEEMAGASKRSPIEMVKK